MSQLTNDGRTNWQAGFIALLPQIECLLQRIYRHLDAERRQESIQAATVYCLMSYIGIHARGRTDTVTASTLVWYASLQLRNGRTPGSKLNASEPLSPYAQRRRGFRVEQLHRYDQEEACWIDDIVEDKRASVLDVVAVRLDFRAWLRTLCKRTKRIARDLARGCTTAETARKYGVTAGRVSQLRRQLEESWFDFQAEPVPLHMR
jgi:hypothetical protein